MNKKMRYNNLTKKAALLMAAVLMLSFTGCKKQEVDYNIEGEDNNTSSDGASASDLKGILQMDTDLWDVSFPSADGAYNNVIYADISVPDTGSMSVLEMEKRKLTNEDKKRIVEGLFDAESIYVWSDRDLPGWYMDERLNMLDETIAFYDSQKDVSIVWDDDTQETYQQLLDERETLQTIKENGAGVGIKTTDYSETMFFGDINGSHYACAFGEYGFSCGISDTSASEMFSDKLIDGGFLTYYESTESEENQCSISEEDLRRQAGSIVSALGDAYTVQNTKALAWINHSLSTDNYVENVWHDGYTFTYTREVNGVSVDGTDYSGMAMDYYANTHSGIIDTYSSLNNRECIIVQMNENGLVSISVPCLYSMKETLTEQANLLPLSKVQGMIQNLLKENSNRYGYTFPGSSKIENIIYSKLELMYMYVADDSTGYVILPVWRLSDYKNNVISKILCVNAIDGSEIDILDNIYNISD